MSHISVPCGLVLSHPAHWIHELQVRVLKSLNFNEFTAYTFWDIHGSSDLLFDLLDRVSELEYYAFSLGLVLII